MATKAQMAVELDNMRHRIACLEADRALLREKLDVAKDTIATLSAKREVPSKPAPGGWHVLSLNGVEYYASRDYGHLSQLARNTKLGQPGWKVEVRRVH